MTDAVIGKGTLLKRAGTTIAEVKSISGPSITRDTLDVTNMDSVGNFREYVTTLQDGGTVDFDVNYIGDNATQNILKTDMDNGTESAYTITMPNVGVTVFSFNALVIAFGINTEIEGIISASISLKITGAVTNT